MTKFRHHRGTLIDSMTTVVEVGSIDELAKIISIAHRLPCGWAPATAEEITVKPYGFDKRIGWDTYIVCLNGEAVGFTDGPL